MKIQVCIGKLCHSFAILWHIFLNDDHTFITIDQNVSIEHKSCVKLLNLLCPKTSMSWNGLALGHYVGYIAKLVLTNIGQFFELKKPPIPIIQIFQNQIIINSNILKKIKIKDPLVIIISLYICFNFMKEPPKTLWFSFLVLNFSYFLKTIVIYQNQFFEFFRETGVCVCVCVQQVCPPFLILATIIINKLVGTLLN